MARDATRSSAVYEPIVKSDATVIDPPTRAIRCGTGGDLVVMRTDGVQVTIPDVQDGETLSIVAKKVMNATTCSGMTALL